MMLLDGDKNYYDLLELTPDASPQEIRSAYLRAKAAYRKDSVALYTLISEAETEELLKKIEEAYQVLSSPERRREYDRRHGSLSAEPSFVETSASKIVSIDRVPPMDSNPSSGDLLVAPSTDFAATHERSSAQNSSHIIGTPSEPDDLFFTNAITSPATSTLPTESVAPLTTSMSAPKQAPVQSASQRASQQNGYRHPPGAFQDQSILQEIEGEKEWRGPFLKRIREARNVPLEELSDYTRISKSYLVAIEEENYSRLPAPVYLRGFLTQVAKYLRLPHDKVTLAYVSRFSQVLQEREKTGRR